MFEFAWDWVFWLAPLPLLIYRGLPPASKNDHYLHTPFLSELLRLTAQQRSFSPTTIKRWLLYTLMWLCFLTAAAQPQLKQQSELLPFSGRNILVAMDLSGSMGNNDVTIDGVSSSRLSLVQHLFQQLIDRRPSDRFGLLYFADQAFLYSPLTLEHATLKRWINEAEVGLAGDQTAIGDAIGLSIKTLRQLDSEKILLLVTDGANTAGVMSPLAAAKLAAREGIRIYAVGVGSRTDQANHLAFNPQLLQEIASTTKGKFFHLTDQASLEKLLNKLQRLEPYQQSQPILHQKALYHWPLGLGLMLFLLIYARGLGKPLMIAVRTSWQYLSRRQS